ncbi:MAG: acyl-CoA thioesterase, partial [Clostridia bacterium]|nr:acyl-CoA thioesterase [Clostridia bacterium]MDY5554234.1 acyl-CoA thioesterase [Blautia sp.]
QVSFDDEIQISVSIKKYNGISLEFNYQFFNITKNEICTTAYSRHCFLKNGKLISVKKEVPELDLIINNCK